MLDAPYLPIPSPERRVWYTPAPASSSSWAVPVPPSPARRRAVPASSLPDELLLYILSCPTLGLRDLAACCLLNRRWLPSARQVLYGARELFLPDARLASTLWNAGHLRALVRHVRLDAHPGVDAASAAGWLCLPGAALRSLAVGGLDPAVVPVLASASRALAQLRALTLDFLSIPLPPALEELDVVDLPPAASAPTVRALTVRRASTPLRLAGFGGLRRLVLLLPPSIRPFRPFESADCLVWSEVPSTVEVLVVSVGLLGAAPAPPPPGLRIELVAPGVLYRRAALALAGSVSAVSCDCERGVRELLEVS